MVTVADDAVLISEKTGDYCVCVCVCVCARVCVNAGIPVYVCT